VMERVSQLDAVVIGGGQAGLAAGYHLRQLGCRFEVLEARPRLGDQWRERWDSLRLFTPARYSHLPGLTLQLPPKSYPTKDQFADYLDGYARHFDLPVRTGIRVLRLSPTSGGFTLETSAGKRRSRTVIVATGPNTRPVVPAMAAALDPAVVQLHSSAYRRPEQLPEGPVVVVGAGTSGAEIALELAGSGRPVHLSGRPTPHIPDAVFRFAGPAYWAFINRVLTLDTPIGRKVAERFHDRGAPLIRISIEDVTAAGVALLPRLTAVVDGAPVFGEVAIGKPAAVVWATGFVPDLDWLPQAPVDRHGQPVTRRGTLDAVPGIGFVGFPFQFSLASALIGGVGRDAGQVVTALISGRPGADPNQGARPARYLRSEPVHS